jgi:hypothetical protein
MQHAQQQDVLYTVGIRRGGRGATRVSARAGQAAGTATMQIENQMKPEKWHCCLTAYSLRSLPALVMFEFPL